MGTSIMQRLILNPTRNLSNSKTKLNAPTTTFKRRFYKNVNIDIEKVLSRQDPKTLYKIKLDNRFLKTYAGNPFVLNSKYLAMAVASEWQSQDKLLSRDNMPLTALCNLCIDVGNDKSKDEIIANLMKYLKTDTLLYRAFDSGMINDNLTKQLLTIQKINGPLQQKKFPNC